MRSRRHSDRHGSMFRRLSKLLLATTTLLGLGIASPAHAYYWGYPYGYGPLSSALWRVGAALYPLRGFGSGYYGPVSYGLGSLGYNAAYLTNSLFGSPYYRPFYYPYPRPYMDMYSYQDEEPLYAPRRRVRSKRPDLETTDQIAQAQWTRPQGNQAAPAVAMPPGYVPPPG